METKTPKFTEVEVDEMLEDGRIKIRVENHPQFVEMLLFIAEYVYINEDWLVREYIDEDLPSPHRIFKEIIKEALVEGYEKDYSWLKRKKCMHPSCGDSDCGNG